MGLAIAGGISGYILGMLISVCILGTASGFLGQTGMTFFGIIGAAGGAFWGYRMDLQGLSLGDVPIGIINLLFTNQDIPREWLDEYEGDELEALLAEVVAETMGRGVEWPLTSKTKVSPLLGGNTRAEFIFANCVLIA